MKTFDFNLRHDLSQLHDELLAGVALLRPAPVDQTGELHARMMVQGSGDLIRLVVPDDANEQAIGAIVRAHQPRPRPASPTLATLMKEIEDIDFDSITTLPQMKAALKTLRTKQVAFMKARAGLP